MKYLILCCVVVMVVGSQVQASESALIDPLLMNKETWSEPVFGAPGEVSKEITRGTASQNEAVKVEIAPTQYLEIRKNIPHSEPSLPKAWVEYKILKE